MSNKSLRNLILFILVSTLPSTTLFAVERTAKEKDASVNATSSGSAVVLKTLVSDKDFQEGRFYIQFNDLDKEPGAFSKMPVEKIFYASSGLARIAGQYQPKDVKRYMATLLNSKTKKISEAKEKGLLKNFENLFSFTCHTKDVEGLLRALRAEKIVKRVERMPKFEIFYTPSDPQVLQQWHLAKINASSAWDTYNAHVGNGDIVLAVVDDAVKMSHQDIQSNLWTNLAELNGISGVDDDGNGYIDDVHGWDVADNDNNPEPPSIATNSDFMHGTHVAGIAGAVSNNGIGITSLAGAALNKIKIMAVKTRADTDTTNTLQSPLEGVAYAISSGANVINMSWGGSVYSSLYQDLFILAHNLGISLVAATGNSNTNSPMFPASYNYVFAVGATDPNDYKATFSNFGYRTDVMAPGVGILSTLPVNNNSYGTLNGTSMASPLVASLAGLMRSYAGSLTPYQVEKLIRDHAINIDPLNPNYVNVIGAGRIDAQAAVNGLTGSVPANEPFTGVVTGIVELGWASQAWGDYDNDGDLDLAIMGRKFLPSSCMEVTKIYRNDGNGIFTDTNANIVQASQGNLAWGDYDNDGYLDLAIAGWASTPSYNMIGKIYHNQGNGILVDSNISITGGDFWTSVNWIDFNNDGKLDLFVGNKFHRNNGGGGFTNMGSLGLPNIGGRQFAWGDYDNDGDMDVALTGFDRSSSVSAPFSAIYQNNNGSFTATSIGLCPLGGGAAAWGDYDNDGDLDLLLSGVAHNGNLVSALSYTKVYRNDGLGAFVDINANIEGVFRSNPSWGDYDNDGYLDILLAGTMDVYTLVAQKLKVYRNAHNDIFTDVAFETYGVWDSNADFVDYNNDGKLDIAASGQSGFTTGQFSLYQNISLNVNTPPLSPVGLQTSLSGNNVLLGWQKATDAQTLQNGLNYNIYLGTSPGGIQSVSPMAQLTNGWRKIVQMGPQRAFSSGNNASYTVQGLACGTTYYWGVQAIDTAFAGSPFAAGAPFTTEPCPTGLLNTVSGTITYGAGQPVPGVSLGATGGVGAPTMNGANYTYNVQTGSTATLTPTASGYTFLPASWSGPVNADIIQNFVGVPIVYTISGKVYSGNQLLTTPLTHDITVKATSTNGMGNFTQTLPAGSATSGYALSNVPYGWSGTIMVTSPSGGYDVNVIGPTTIVPMQGAVSRDINATLRIKGAVSGQLPSGANNSDIQITAAGGVPALPATQVPVDPNGTYEINGIPSGWTGGTLTVQIQTPNALYQVVPNASGSTFLPSASMMDHAAQNYTIQAFLKVTGRVYMKINEGFKGINGVKILDTTNPASPIQLAMTATMSGVDGMYTFYQPVGWGTPGSPGGVRTIKPSLLLSQTSYPVSRSYETPLGLQHDVALQDYIVDDLNVSISGTVTVNGAPLAGAKLTAYDTNGAVWTYATTASNGSYSLTVQGGWQGQVKLTRPGGVLSAAAGSSLSIAYSPLTQNQPNKNYLVQFAPYKITGSITGLNPLITSGLQIMARKTGTTLTTPVTVTGTGSTRSYSVTPPAAWDGASVTITVSAPAAASFTLSGNSQYALPLTANKMQNYAAQSLVVGTNPNVTAARQTHY